MDAAEVGVLAHRRVGRRRGAHPRLADLLVQGTVYGPNQKSYFDFVPAGCGM
jgi:hypothetical protein